MYQTLAIVIPSLEPTAILVAYVQALVEQGFPHIYVVNDGSSADYAPIFEQVRALRGCTLLTHAVNRGKGAALKTAYREIQQNFPTCQGIVTADSDGQHAVADVCQLADALLQGAEGLLLGGRNFAQQGIPLKSWVGNRMASTVFFLLHGTWVADTQTGLRAFPMARLPQMLEIAGDRFAYEMAVLVTCANQKIPMQSLSIDTIYLEDNAGTHFQPLQDSLQIARVLLQKLMRFVLSAGVSTAVDIGLCWMLLYALTGAVTDDLLRIGMAIVLARLVSMGVNFTLNQRLVFHSHARHGFARYVLLAAANVCASVTFVYLGHTLWHLDEGWLKVCADGLLFCVNYQVQRCWVFSNQKKENQK